MGREKMQTVTAGIESVRPPPQISVVVPVYNEEEVLLHFKERLEKVLDALLYEWEAVFVNDGSSDKSAEILKGFHLQNPRIKVISFSRNFGHQMAITAGINEACGAAVIVMDVDLQDPPELIPEFLKKWHEGYHVVYGVRKSRRGENWFKRETAAQFYKFIRWLSGIDIPENAGDFRLMDRKAVDLLREMPEQHRFVRGMVAWLGFNQIGVEFERPPRFAGETKYPLKKMVWLALDSSVSFSILPLRLASLLGAGSGFLCLIVLAWTLFEKIVLHVTLQGWASLMTAILFVGSAQLLAIGILGEYVGRNYQEAKRRPLYVIKDKTGFSPASWSPHAESVCCDQDQGR